jgi:hypothetical protein
MVHSATSPLLPTRLHDSDILMKLSGQQSRQWPQWLLPQASRQPGIAVNIGKGLWLYRIQFHAHFAAVRPTSMNKNDHRQLLSLSVGMKAAAATGLLQNSCSF